MTIEINPSRKALAGNPAAALLVEVLESEETAWGLNGSSLYLDFPVYRDAEGELVTPQIMILSRVHGVVIVGLTGARKPLQNEVENLTDRVNGELQHIYGRLLSSRVLPKSKTRLLVPVNAIIYGPYLTVDVRALAPDTPVLVTKADVGAFLGGAGAAASPLDAEHLAEIQALIDGTKGLRSPKKREVAAKEPTSKGVLAAKLEAEIATLDQKQRHGSMVSVQGAQRIRGIAGSGKTVILAMKAALAQILHPDARILYTFHTRSLYQHIRYLITRAYRNRDYHDPNWELLKVLHSWGGRAAAGVYSTACDLAGVRPMTYTQASQEASGGTDAFEHACKTLLDTGRVQPYFDFAFIDEGQDFRPSFLQLCAALTKGNQFVVASDELQTIFQASAPTAAQMFGLKADGTSLVEFQEEIILHKCYRNPRQILVCAHAIGFGLYGPRIAQLPEDEEHWNDLGYLVESGEMKADSRVIIMRPEENSPNTISRTESVDECISAIYFDTLENEIAYVATSIEGDISQGLRPDDIMVVSLDNRNAQYYLERISRVLAQHGIKSHDVHAMRVATGDFSVENHVTLTTISKAKGNEAYMVYLVGVDAVWDSMPSVLNRNLVFTGLTRAKGWVRVSGMGTNAEVFAGELNRAKAKYPRLEFSFPTDDAVRRMKRDLEAAAAHRVELERMLEKFTPEEVERLLADRRAKASKKA